MDKLLEQAENTLKDKLSQIPEKFLEHEDKEVREFIKQVGVFLALTEFKKDEIKSLLKIWDKVESVIIGENPFDIQSIILHKSQLKDEILRSLKELELYNITDKELIHSYLYSALIASFYVSKSDIDFLKRIQDSLLSSYSEWGEKTGLTSNGARFKWERLQEQIFVRVIMWPNYQKLKLKLFMAYVKVNKRPFLIKNLIKGLLSSPFRRSIGKFRSHPDELYFTLQIPDTPKCYHLVEKSFKKMLENDLIDSFKITEIMAIYRDINFELFSAKSNKWMFSPKLWINYLEGFLPENEAIIQPPQKFEFEPYSLKVYKKDLHIIDSLMPDGRIKNKILARKVGTTARNVLYRKEFLFENNFLTPKIVAQNIGLEGYIVFLMEGDDLLIERFKKACEKIPQWYCFDYIGKGSSNGSMFALEIPIEHLWELILYFDDIYSKFRTKKIWYDFFSLASYTISGIIDRWDEKKQRWIWNNSDLDIITLSGLDRYL